MLLAYENYPYTGVNSEQAALVQDRSALLGAAIGKLPARQREAVEHLAVREQSLAEAAVATGRTTGSLRVDRQSPRAQDVANPTRRKGLRDGPLRFK